MENYTTKNVTEYGTVYYCNPDKQLHRLDGPAVERGSNRGWYLFNKGYFKTEHNKLVLFLLLEPKRIEMNPMK